MAVFIPDGMRKSVEIAATQAYRTVESDPNWTYGPDTAHRSRVCGSVTSIMLRQLIAFGYDVQQEIRRGQEIEDEHSYLQIEPSGLRVIADATWQQFVPEELYTPGLPKVLMGDRVDVVGQAQEFGVPDKYLKLWQERPRK